MEYQHNELAIELSRTAVAMGFGPSEFGWHSQITSEFRRYEAWVGPRHLVVSSIRVPNSIWAEDALRVGIAMMVWDLSEDRSNV